MRVGRVALAVALAIGGAGAAPAQDSLAAPPVRHLLGLAFTRVQPFHRSYDVNVLTGDSTVRVGQRDVTLSEAALSDSASGWLLTETRDGLVSAVDSLFLGLDLRPVRWSATAGPARVQLSFAGDSLRGAALSPRSRAAIAAECPPDVIVSGPMLELVLGLVPLSPSWADSAHMLSTTLAGAVVRPVELLVVGEDSTAAAAGPHRPVWLVGVNAEAGRVVLWVDKASGTMVRSQQGLQAHAGTLLEYRERAGSATSPP